MIWPDVPFTWLKKQGIYSYFHFILSGRFSMVADYLLDQQPSSY
jgi:hypothetical protein